MAAVGKRIISVVLLVTIVLSFSACSFVGGIDISNNNQLTVQEIARLVVNAINDEKNVSDSYSSIPEDQREGVSYSYYSEFANILRHMSKKNQNVSSFRIMNESEKNQYLNNIYESSGCPKSYMRAYGSVDIIEMSYSDSDSLKCCFFISSDHNGKAYLSSTYISDFIGSYNYIEHYFTMINEKNIDGIIALLKPKLQDSIYINPVLEAKAKTISNYYRNSVKSVTNDYIFNVISPFYMEVTILETVDNDGYSIVPHKVSVTKNIDNTYYINDVISFDNSIKGCDIYNEYSQLYSIGDVVTKEQIYELVGVPYNDIIEPLEEYSDDDYKSVIKLYYVNMIIEINGNVEDDGSWNGRITSTSVFNQKYSVNDEIYLGMSISELLLIYPMIDDYDYKYTFVDGDEKYSFEFGYDEYYNLNSIMVRRVT